MPDTSPATVNEATLWDLDEVTDGSVIDRHGKVMRLRVLIQRRWGWPRAAAEEAAEILRARALPRAVVLGLSPAARLKQQRALISDHPEIMHAMIEGLARGRASRDHRQAGLRVQRIEIAFSKPIDNEGLVSDLLDAIGQRCGEEARRGLEVFPHGAGEHPAVSIEVPIEDDDG